MLDAWNVVSLRHVNPCGAEQYQDCHEVTKDRKRLYGVLESHNEETKNFKVAQELQKANQRQNEAKPHLQALRRGDKRNEAEGQRTCSKQIGPVQRIFDVIRLGGCSDQPQKHFSKEKDVDHDIESKQCSAIHAAIRFINECGIVQGNTQQNQELKGPGNCPCQSGGVGIAQCLPNALRPCPPHQANHWMHCGRSTIVCQGLLCLQLPGYLEIDGLAQFWVPPLLEGRIGRQRNDAGLTLHHRRTAL
mmetsp:Transcript_19105/g.42205  ORF Transcript_19105/g.42205 Transcript_19105/m.42205 type:complete len:247 (+) Transcript_19105:748-1488(+)